MNSLDRRTPTRTDRRRRTPTPSPSARSRPQRTTMTRRWWSGKKSMLHLQSSQTVTNRWICPTRDQHHPPSRLSLATTGASLLPGLCVTMRHPCSPGHSTLLTLADRPVRMAPRVRRWTCTGFRTRTTGRPRRTRRKEITSVTRTSATRPLQKGVPSPDTNTNIQVHRSPSNFMPFLSFFLSFFLSLSSPSLSF